MDRLKVPFRVANTLALFMVVYAMLVNPSFAAPMGAGFEFEGRLGNVTGSYDFKFRLYNAPSGGVTVYGTTAVANAVPVVNGEYRAPMRFGEGVTSVLAGEAIYVEVLYRVATTNANAPYTLQPGARAQLMPTAYAMSLRPGARVRGNVPGAGLFVTNTGNGTGIAGQSTGGSGVTGQSTLWIGVYGVSQTQTGVWGNSTSGAGVHGSSASNSGVWGKSTSGAGVHGVSATNAAVWGLSTSGAGVWGQSSSWIGVHGESQTQTGVLGKSTTATGVWGDSRDWIGVLGLSEKQTGVAGKSTNGAGMTGESRDHYGVYGTSTKSDGVQGVTGATNFSGVAGIHTGSGYGVYGTSTNGTGVQGVANNQYRTGVAAVNTAGGTALSVTGNATQSLGSGGIVKAMALIDPSDTADPIKQCYNGQLQGTQATSGNCGMNVLLHTGCSSFHTVNFGFKVDNRFVVATPFYSTGNGSNLNLYPNTETSWAVLTYNTGSGESTCAKFFIAVY